MAYIAPIHRPSSVRHALKLNLLDPIEECLVLAKANRIEIHTITNDGISLQNTRAVYGKITMLNKIRPQGSEIDYLFVGTDRYMYFTLSWNADLQKLQTEDKYIDQSSKGARDTESDDRCLIDPTRRFMTLQLYEGIVTVIPLQQKGRKKNGPGTLGDPLPCRISNLFVRSSAFLYPREVDNEKPRLALLHEDNHRKVYLTVRTLDYSPGISGDAGTVDLDEVNSSLKDLEIGSGHLIPVPAPAYGILVLAENEIRYIGNAKNAQVTRPLEQLTVFAAWAPVDSQRWLLADEYGKLYLFMLILSDNDRVSDWKLDVIGEISSAAVLVYLDNGYVFVGSHEGDSQVIKILEKSIELVQTIPNIGPILDFTIMDLGNRAAEGQMSEYSSGQARIVTGSGAFQDGSLRSVRSGVGMEELGSLGDVQNIREIFAISSSADSQSSDVLVVSFVNETRVFQFNAEGEVEEKADFVGLSLGEETLLATNIPSDHILQVTSSSAQVIDLENGMVVAQWSSPKDTVITAASTNKLHLALAVGGTEIVVLKLTEQLGVKVRRTFPNEGQLACIDVPPVLADICVVGFWQSAIVSLLDLNTLDTIRSEVLSEDAVSVPRSVLILPVLFAQSPTLFVAMADGNVVTFFVDPTDYSMSGKKSVVLGTQQANFKALPRGDGVYNVFATCEHPSLIYGSEGRIVYSAVTAEDATCVCPFDSKAYPGAIAIATSEDLKIALVDTERTTHVRTLHVHETVRRVAYSAKLKAFGFGTIKRTLQDGAEEIQCSVKLADEVLFKELDSYELKEDELVESVIRAELPEERFIVGTGYLNDSHDNNIRGRILVFDVTKDRTLKLAAQLSVKGACRCLGVLEGKIVAALVKTVAIYALSGTNFHKLTAYRTSTAPVALSVTGTTIAVADLMKSVSILSYKPGPAGQPDTLTETARHYQTFWATALATVAPDTYLSSGAEGNLVVLQPNTAGVTSDDRRRLEPVSEIRLGEFVNHILSITVPSPPTATVAPKAFLATVEGAIYLFGLIAPGKEDVLMRLQAEVAGYVESPGGMEFMRYRAFKTPVKESEEPFRFVDGELVEAFLELNRGVQEGICGRLGVGAEEVRALVEGLRRLR